MLAWPSSSLAVTLGLLFGSLVGSFLNVVIYRLPQGLSVVTPRSYCPSCRRTVRWYENIPVFSYLFLAGRCHGCRARISFRYPLVEILTAVLASAVVVKFGLTARAGYYFLFFVSPLIAITLIDLDHQIIPDELSLPGIALGLLGSAWLGPHAWVENTIQSGLGILAGGGVLFTISWFYEKVRHQEGLGGGDVKLAAMIGAFLGWRAVFMVLLLSSLLGSVVGLLLMIIFRKGLKLAIPFGPFLAGASLLYLFYGHELINLYLKWTVGKMYN